MKALGLYTCLLLLSLAAVAGGSAAFRPVDLRCEYLRDPLGIDAPRPRLSWVLEPARRSPRGQTQGSWHVLVASSRKNLDHNVGDLWDSGRVSSSDSIQVPYAGKKLGSEQPCFWKVRTWDQDGKPSRWSEPAFWTMGLLSPSDWKAQWIGRDEPVARTDLPATSWIWFPEGHPETAAPVGTRFFRRQFLLPADRVVKSARWLVTGDNEFKAFLNGSPVGSGANFKSLVSIDLRPHLHPGTNLLAASVSNTGDQPNPAGFLGLVRIEFEQGEPLTLPTDERWQSSAERFASWEKPGYDDSTWLPARKLGPAGMAPWGEVEAEMDRRLPARWLRKEFRVEKKVRRATAWFSGVGLSEFYLNGEKVGNDVLSPGLTDYDKRVYYVTRDVSRLLRRGPNAVGVLLGNGRFFAPRGAGSRTYGFPKLRFQLRVEYTDGSEQLLVSDESWRLTTGGPIQANNEYDGEDYDARLEMPGWARAGFDDSSWSPAHLVSPPAGMMSAQMIEPIRVTQILKPVRLTELRPGVYIFDMGQNLVGWCRLQVSGPRGTTVTLRHAETLTPEGSLYVDNLRTAKATDHYTLSGKGREVYQPRFTYHGFRFVELTGFPGKPSLATLQGCVVHDDLESAGSFTCSNLLLDRILKNVIWGVRGNYRSIPTDCPQRDERQGWLGDRSEESRGEGYLFNTAAFYSKWLQDMVDAQKDTGSVPDVCPPYWPLYSDDVTWPSSTVIIPGALWDQFADRSLLERHYESARKWMSYMTAFLTNGIIERDSYGDWCVPPEDPKLIHSNDPRRKTDRGLLATAYFYRDARLMSAYATRLGKRDDAREYDALADSIKNAFNEKFLRPAEGQYDNGSQTSCVPPLAFGLVPDAQRERIFQHLVEKITTESHGHVGTGLIGGQWLMRVLSDNGRPDLACTIASQTDYPSWGYMLKKGATTIWELWNGDTADPAMNSGNHVMLVGDYVTWLYEYLAGIRPDPDRPGFKHIILRPVPVDELQFVRASHRSLFGLVASEWRRENNLFYWKITVPVNTAATAYIPTAGGGAVLESGRPAAQAPGVKFLRAEKGCAVYELGSGTYEFQSVER